MAEKLLKTLGQGQGYLKAGFLGFPKSGKTYTSMLLAIAARKMFGIKTPIAMFDTEGGSEYIAKMVKTFTGQDLIGIRSRGFNDLMQTTKEIEAEGIQIFVVDSITHPWRELCEAYLKNINERRIENNRQPRTRLEFQDWNVIKPTWAKWTDWYLNSKVHVIVAGRAGFEYDYEINETTEKKELVKTGVKMKTEVEFGFEPALLIEMERIQNNNGDVMKLLHRAIVIGDRFGLIDGNTCEFKGLKNQQVELDEVTKFFSPHLKALTPNVHAPVDTQVKSDLGVDEEGNAEWNREKRQRTIFCEEIEGELVKFAPGQSKDEKMAKLELIELAFDTRSWTKVQNLNSDTLKAGLDTIRQEIARRQRVQVDVKAETPEKAEQQEKTLKAVEEFYDSKRKIKHPTPKQARNLIDMALEYKKQNTKQIPAGSLIDTHKFNLAVYKLLNKWPNTESEFKECILLVKLEDVLNEE